MARGQVLLNDQQLREGDGAAVASVPKLSLSTEEGGEVLLFDLA